MAAMARYRLGGCVPTRRRCPSPTGAGCGINGRREPTIKPSIANLLVWRTIYEHDDVFYVDAIRVGMSNDPLICGEPATVEVLTTEKHLPWLKPSQQWVDVSRFSWFSEDYVAIDPEASNRIIDVRYSVVPNQIDPLWGIEPDPGAAPDEHVGYVVARRISAAQRTAFLRLLTGADCTGTISSGSSH